MTPGGLWRRAGRSGLRAYALAFLLLIPILAGHGPVGMLLESGGPGGLLSLLSTPISRLPPSTAQAPAAPAGLGQALSQKVSQAAGDLLSGKTRSLAVWGYFHTTPLYFFLVVLAGLVVLNFIPRAGQASSARPPVLGAWLAALALAGYAVFQLHALLGRARPGLGALALVLLAACLGLGARLAWRARNQEGGLLWLVLLLSALASLMAVLLANQFKSTSGDYFRQPLAWGVNLLLAMALVRLAGRTDLRPWLRTLLILGLWAAVVMDGWVSFVFWAGYIPYQGQQMGMMFNLK